MELFSLWIRNFFIGPVPMFTWNGFWLRSDSSPGPVKGLPEVPKPHTHGTSRG